MSLQTHNAQDFWDYILNYPEIFDFWFDNENRRKKSKNRYMSNGGDFERLRAPQVVREAAFGLPSAFLVLLLSPWSYYQNPNIVLTINHHKKDFNYIIQETEIATRIRLEFSCYHKNSLCYTFWSFYQMLPNRGTWTNLACFRVCKRWSSFVLWTEF